MKISLILILFIHNVYALNHRCGTDKLKIDLNSLKIPSKEKRIAKLSKLNAAGTYQPITIGYDFSNFYKPSSMSYRIFNNIKLLLKETREYFSKFLQVVHTNIDISDYFQDIIEVCGIYKIGKDYENFLIKNDLIIFPMIEELEEGVIAAAAPCLLDYDTMRPIGGILYINQNLDFDAGNTETYMKNILIHEITHILVFHPFFFENLGLSKEEGSLSYISSPKVLEQARKHFNCSLLKGVPLEDQGGEGSVGSHWETRQMLGDYMISTDYPDNAISNITLALFEDSGFYKVNYYSGGLFKFGKNKGCEFFKKKCIENGKATFEEFCDIKDEPMCSSSRALKSSCFIYDYQFTIPYEYRYFSRSNRGGFWTAEYCPVALEFVTGTSDIFPNHCQIGTSNLSSEYGETIGQNSFCFMSSLLPESSLNEISEIPICYEVECDTTNNNIIVKLGSDTITCPTEGGIIDNLSGYKGSIRCPQYSDICNNNGIVCNDMFSCLNELSKNNDISSSYLDYDEGKTVDIDYDFFDFYYGYDNFIKINMNYMILLILFWLI